MHGDPSASRDLSQLIVSWRNGNKAALDEMSGVLNNELRRPAHYVLSAERLNRTLQPTGLVHEDYLRRAPFRATSQE